jgi:radical SAM superfamily enzyme YgiQ (UPF0313 family)
MLDRPRTSRRLVLVSLDWLRSKDPRTSLGHASLLARLKAAPELEVASVARAVNAPDFDRRELLADVRRALVADASLAVGVYVWNDEIVRWLLPELRRGGFTGTIILGGPQLSYAPAGVAEIYPEADVIIRGYGEDALLQVLTGHDRRPVPGVVRRGDRDRGDQAAVDLASLPSPILTGVLPVHPFMRWETQRGCIYACSFCQHREPGARLTRRMLAAGRIRDEIDAMVDGGVQDLAVLDPIFNTNPDATAILEHFATRGYRGRLSLQARFELLDDAFLDACADLDVVLEFGLQTVIASEMKAAARINRLERVEGAIEALHRRGVPFEVSLIYGLPTQTLASFQQTIRWCQERGVAVIRAFPLMLLRGTRLERDRDRWGLVESDEVIPVVVASDSFDLAEWEDMRALANSLERVESARGVA